MHQISNDIRLRVLKLGGGGHCVVNCVLGKVIETRFVAYGALYVKKPPKY